MRDSESREKASVWQRYLLLTWLDFEVLETKYHTLLPLDACIGLSLLSYETESVCLAGATQNMTKEGLQRHI